MNNQELERKMNQFERRHQIWKVEIEDLLTRLARVTKEGFTDVNAKINALVDSQIRLEEQQKKTDEQLRQNAEQQRKTDEHLRRTDELLRRHLGGRRNGENKN